MQQPSDPDDNLPCKAQIGFLFKRTCGRMDRTGCQFCKGRPLSGRTDTWTRDTDPYYYDRSMYQGYGNYSSGHWGYGYYNDWDRHDFTDADSCSLMAEHDTDFKQDMGS